MPSDRLASDDPTARAPLASAAGCWVFDVDGCLVDSLTGTSLRPGTRELLEHLARNGRHIILWSAGGDAYAQARAKEFGVDHLVGGFFAKDGRDVDWPLPDDASAPRPPTAPSSSTTGPKTWPLTSTSSRSPRT